MSRPYRTEYYLNDDEVPTSLGHSASEKGAIRGAVVRIFMKQYDNARVSRDGVLLFNIRTGATGIQVRYGRS